MYFEYGDAEICYLKERDARLAEVIDSVGHIYREADTDLFSSIVHHIIGQQISTKAQATIWKRMQDRLGNVSAENIAEASEENLQSLGITYRKAEYIKVFASYRTERHWCMDCRDDTPFLSSASRYIQLSGPCDPAWPQDDLSSQSNNQRII